MGTLLKKLRTFTIEFKSSIMMDGAVSTVLDFDAVSIKYNRVKQEAIHLHYSCKSEISRQ